MLSSVAKAHTIVIPIKSVRLPVANTAKIPVNVESVIVFILVY